MSALEFTFQGWVCEDCWLTHAGFDRHELGEHDSEFEPLGLIEDGTVLFAGITDDMHECESRWVGHRSRIGCGEEVRDFDTAPCDGCGSGLAGTRYGMTFWSVTR